MAKKKTGLGFTPKRREEHLKKHIEDQVSKSEKDKVINFSVRLPQALYDDVKEDAETYGCTVSDVVRAVLTKEYH